MSKAGIDGILESDEGAAEQPVQTAVPSRASEMRASAPVSPWVHFFAGGIAGMAGATVTSPLDVVKTRLQSSEFLKDSEELRKRNLAKQQGGASNAAAQASQSHPVVKNPALNLTNHPVRRSLIGRGYTQVSETVQIINTVYKTEGGRALFRGLGPNLAGAVPARAVNFFSYGLAKDTLAPLFGDDEQKKPQTHLASGIAAGFVTSTATNPIWVIKTRLQLDRAKNGKRLYKNSLDCFQHIVKNEGFRALYRGLSASFLGSSESSMQWVLYEQMRRFIKRRQEVRQAQGAELTASDKFWDWSATSGAAGAAKFLASLITYPHEVVRTRLRQAPQENGQPKYTGLLQCFRRIIAEEGAGALYGGLTPHLLRTVPNSIIMFGTWDLIVRCFS